MKLQPFELFKKAYLKNLVSLKKIYLVSQLYPSGQFVNDDKTALLVTDYDDIGLAKIHLAAVKQDLFAAVVDLTNAHHFKRFENILNEDSGFRVFWAVVKSNDQLKKKVDSHYRDNIRRFIEKNTSWRVSADEHLKAQLQVIFGELFVTLKRGSQELRVKFADIQNS